MRIVVLRNLRAGLRGLPGHAASVASHPLFQARSSPVKLELLETADLGALQIAAMKLAANPPELICFWGGDGTITTTLSALIAEHGSTPLPPFLFLPGGTVNVIARELGIRGGPVQTLERLVRRVEQGAPPEPLERTAIRCLGRAGFLFGIGLIPNFHAVYNTSGTGGSRRAVQVLARAAGDALWGGRLAQALFDPFDARIELEQGQIIEGRWTNVSAGGIEGLGFGFRPYLRAAERRGAFHLVAHALTARAALLEMPRVRLGFGMKAGEHAVTERAEVRLDRPLRWGFDGDTFDPVDHLVLEGGLTVRLWRV